MIFYPIEQVFFLNAAYFLNRDNQSNCDCAEVIRMNMTIDLAGIMPLVLYYMVAHAKMLRFSVHHSVHAIVYVN